ncbi:MAG: type I restriction-modification system subunit M N-terminal domain-containing protein, partial [Treponema sp.]|nr:type I restriction-modification system subunit M N-terminal domain-containing protein [Treponema sp.]
MKGIETGEGTTALGFEKEIWDAACVLRDNIDAAEYKHVVLGLIFLKYLSDKFEDRYNALKDEGEGFEEDRDAYAEKQVFYVP